MNKALMMELARCEYIEHRGERDRRRQQRHRQDPRRPGAGSGCLSAGDVRGLHHRHRPGPRADGGQGRKAPAQPAAATGPPQAADHRRVGLRPSVTTGAELLFEVFSQRYERAPSWSQPTSPSTSGPTCSAPNGLPEPCWTASPTTSTSWR